MIFYHYVAACRSFVHVETFKRIMMRIQLVLLSLIFIVQSNANDLKAQKLTLKADQMSLENVLKEITKQTAYDFLYNPDLLRKNAIPVTLSQVDKPLNEVLTHIFNAQPRLTFAVDQKTVIVKPKKEDIPYKPIGIMQQGIHGTVTDKNGEPLSGVSVQIKGTETVVSTDSNGHFSISASPGKNLVFNLIGFQPQEITIKNTAALQVQLEESVSDLDEVVVVGYGTQAKKDLTGAISTIGGNEITERGVSNVSSALQGAVPGLSVTRGGSAPGSGGSMLLRGMTTLEGSSDPLVLVDDLPVGSIDDVNPEQIESISVLKDGAAAAIYGSRAAAGVIIITTKRAKNDVFSLNYSGEQIINAPTTKPDVISPVRYMEIYNEYMWNDAGNGSDKFPGYGEQLIADYAELNKQNPDQYPITDWSDLILKDHAPGYRHNLTMSGGTDKVKTLGTFGYERQDALYDHRKWERYTVRINNDVRLSDKFGGLFDLALRVSTSDQPSLDPTSAAFDYAPIYAATWSDGRIASGKQGDNLYAMLQEGGFSSNKTYRLNGKFGAFYKPNDALKLSVNVAPRYDFRRYKSFNSTIPYWAYDDPEKAQSPRYISGHNDMQATLVEERDFFRSLTAQGLINFDKNFGEHRLSGVAGIEMFYSETENLDVRGREFISNDYPYMNQAPVDRVFDDGSGLSELAYTSYFGRLDYNYASKYYLQANVRTDGSSRFSKNYRWGTFPSMSAAWALSEEDFFEPLKSWVDFAKLRLSYGSLGNDRLGNYLYLSTLQFMNALFLDGSDVVSQYTAAQRYLAIEDITWETTTTSNIGIDLMLLNNRLSFAGEYFQKNTKNMLLAVSVPKLTGYEDPMDNVGDMKTKGWEINIGWKDRVGAVDYALSFNLFDSKSTIGDIQGKRIIGSSTISEQGTEYNAWYGYRSDGIYQNQEEVDQSATTSNNVKIGDIKYMDINGPDGVPDGLINEFDRTLLGGTTLPRFQYGGTLRLGYKGFDMNMVVQGIGKQKARLTESLVRPFRASWLSPPAIIDGNYWSHYNTPEENLAATYPRLSQNSVNNNYAFSDFWLINGSYFRLKNITIGYNIPTSTWGKVGISSFRVFLSGNDIFSSSHFPKGIDPEYNSGYLITKSYQIGINLRF